MAFVVSNWRVRYDVTGPSAFTLVNFLDEIDEELEIPWSQRVDTSKPMRGAGAKKFGRSQVETTLTLGVWKIHATHAAARNYCLAQAATVPTGVSSSLSIEVKDGEIYYLPDCVIAGGMPKMMRGEGPIRTWVQYKLEGGKIFTT